MFNLKEKFEFLEEGIDFPFYNDIPKLSGVDWAILVAAVLIFICLVNIHGFFPKYKFLMYFAVTVIPALYVCKGNYGIFFKKPKLRDIKTIVLCLVLYIIYGVLVAYLMKAFGNPAAGDAVLNNGSKLMYLVGLVVQLWGEEFFKILLLIVIMYLVYKFTDNRNLAIRIAIIVTLITFGLAHMSAYGNLMQVLLIQGLGSIFDLYAYMKTKNVIISYTVHLLTDIYGSLPYLFMS